MVAQRLRGVKGASGADGDSHMRQMERLLLSVKKHFLKKIPPNMNTQNEELAQR